jgi:hypothetical protein
MMTLTLALTSGCATKPVVVDTACASFKPILPSRRDVLTRGTIDQILAHNETWEARCGEVKLP